MSNFATKDDIECQQVFSKMFLLVLKYTFLLYSESQRVQVQVYHKNLASKPAWKYEELRTVTYEGLLYVHLKHHKKQVDYLV